MRLYKVPIDEELRHCSIQCLCIRKTNRARHAKTHNSLLAYISLIANRARPIESLPKRGLFIWVFGMRGKWGAYNIRETEATAHVRLVMPFGVVAWRSASRGGGTKHAVENIPICRHGREIVVSVVCWVLV